MPAEGDGIPDDGEGIPLEGDGIPDDGDGIPLDGDGMPEDGEGIPLEGDPLDIDDELEHAARALAAPTTRAHLIRLMNSVRIPHLVGDERISTATRNNVSGAQAA